MTLGCTDIGNKKPEFVAKTQFLYKLVLMNSKKGSDENTNQSNLNYQIIFRS